MSEAITTVEYKSNPTFKKRTKKGAMEGENGNQNRKFEEERKLTAQMGTKSYTLTIILALIVDKNSFFSYCSNSR